MPHAAARPTGGLVLATALAGFGATTAQATPRADVVTHVPAATRGTDAHSASASVSAAAVSAVSSVSAVSAAGDAQPVDRGSVRTAAAPPRSAFARGTGVKPSHLGVAAGGGGLVGLVALAIRGVRRARATGPTARRGDA